jgi:hypothetical protein
VNARRSFSLGNAVVLVTLLNVALPALCAADSPGAREAPSAGSAEEQPGAAIDPIQRVRARVDHHLRQVDAIIRELEGVAAQGCPKLGSAGVWDAWVDRELDRLVLLFAHAEEAWAEAKQTGDDDVRRAAKAPRQHIGRARGLLDTFQRCADDNGARLDSFELWRRVERDVQRRRAEIALPR